MGVYENLKHNGTLDQLMQLTCYSVENLQVEYAVRGECAVAFVSAFLADGNLYVDTSKSRDTIYLAIELAKLFGNAPGLESFLITLFERNTEDQMETLLTAMKIGALPPGEMEHFSTERLDEDEAQEEEETTDGEDDVHEEARPEDLGRDATEDEAVEIDEATGIEEELPDEELEDTEETDASVDSEVSEPTAGGKPATGREDRAGESSTSYPSSGRKSATRTHTWKGTLDSDSPTEGPQREQTRDKRGASGTYQCTRERAEKADWQPECEAEDAHVRAEEFVAKRREFRGNHTSGVSGKERARGSGPEDTEYDDGAKGLTQAAKNAIGRWGEQYTLKSLREHFVKKYPGAKLQTTYDGFNLWQNNRILVAVQWLNRVADAGRGHDIKVIEKENEIFIEVKSSKTAGKEWFDVSQRQWEFAEHYRENFYIYRVLSAGTKQATLIEICNPFGKWEQGELVAYPIRVHI